MNKKLGNCKNNICQKGGVKIHETVTCANDEDQLEFFNRIKAQNKHTGIRINQSENEYNEDPFSGLNPFKSKDEAKFVPTNYDNKSYDKMDLNIDSYSREDLFRLFGLNNISLSEDIMKECKKTVLKTHPDKSKLDEKYFIFFSKAYKKLLSIYEFQNKTNSKKSTDTNEYFDSENVEILDNFFDKQKKIKDPKNFNEWFNSQFDKHKLEDPQESGYGNWLKSDEDIVFMPNVSKSNMAAEMEKRKKHVQSLITYNGVSENTSSAFGGSTLMSYDSNFTAGSIFSNEGMTYTDLRQAYAESVIPVTEDDYNKVKKFRSIDEYKRHRESVDTKPLEKEEAMKQLYLQNKQKDEESAALAFYYAKQSEKAQKNQESFWSGLKQLTNW
jgi:curved DNA-binding protein CbpA